MRPTKDEVMAYIKPSAPSEAELAGLEKLEPGDYVSVLTNTPEYARASRISPTELSTSWI